MTDGPAAGWYPDPQQDGQLRWWDGTAWTDHVSDGAPTSEASWPGGDLGGAGTGAGASYGGSYGTTGAGPAYGTGGMGGAGPHAGVGTWPGQPPSTMLWQSILFTFVCCLPLGVVAIVFAAQANQAVQSGDYATASQRAHQAKTTMMIGFGLVLALVVMGIFAAASGNA